MMKGGVSMFNEFEKFFNLSTEEDDPSANGTLTLFRRKYNGMSLGDGIFRVFRDDDIEKWRQIITEAYPELVFCFEPFAYDWLGRCFAIDLRNGTRDNVFLIEIGTADVLEIPLRFIDFIENEIPLNHEACLATSFFGKWKKGNPNDLQHDKCAGYKIPLFLGGSDTIDNLELSDMEVYWYVCSAAKNRR
jgi:hypothetical protein